MTGATAVLPFDHSTRNKLRMHERDEGGNLKGYGGYATGAHNDNTHNSGPNRCACCLALLRPADPR